MKICVYLRFLRYLRASVPDFGKPLPNIRQPLPTVFAGFIPRFYASIFALRR
jgi:hypothetical protein